MRYGRGALALFAAAALIGAGCGDDGGGEAAGGSADKSPVEIGTSLPLTGPLAEFGKNARQGYELAVKDINAKGGVDGRKLELEVVDDAAEPAKAARAVREFIRNDVDVVLGSYGSGPSMTMTAEAERAGVPNVMPFASDPSIVSQGHKWLINLFTPVDLAEEVADEFLTEVVKPQRLAIIYMDSPFTVAAAKASRENLRAANVRIVMDEKFDPTTEDFTTLVSKAKQQNADVVKFYGLAPQYLAIMPAMKQLQYNPRAVYESLQVPFEPRTIEALGSTGEGVLGIPYSLNPEFDQHVAKATGQEPKGHETYQSYSAVQIIADAVKRAGGTDPEALNKALHETNLETVVGRFRFDERGQAVYTPSLAQVQDGKPVVVWDGETGNTNAFQEWTPFSERG